MENASDALIMAADILIFIVALTLCISSFSTVRQGVDSIINRPETIKMAKDSQGYINYIQSDKQKATRVVGIETLVPSLYRAIKENYVVYIKFKNNYLFSGITPIEAKRNVIINKGTSDEIKIISQNDTIYMFKVGYSADSNTYINTLLSNISNHLYNNLSDGIFYEYLGEFQYDTATNLEDRTTYRIITYIEK